MFLDFGGGDDGPNPDKGLCIPFNVKIFEILPVLDYVFKHTLCRVEALETCRELKSSHSDVLHHVTVFLSKLYTQVENASKPSTLSETKLMASILVNVNKFFFDLDAPIESSCGYRLCFYKIHDVDNKQWTLKDIRAATTFTYANLDKLDLYLSGLVSGYRKPRRSARRWMYYTLGTIGISVFSVWLLRRSRLSDNNDSSILEAISCNFTDPVKLQVNELCKSFRARAEMKPMVHSMLMKHIGAKSLGNLSDKEMMDITWSRMQNQIEHPIRNISKVDELIQGFLIQVQRLELNYEMAKDDLNDSFTANMFKIAIAANLPEIAITLGTVIMIRSAYRKMLSSADRVRRSQSRELLKDIGIRSKEFLECSETPTKQPDKIETSASYLHGLVLCSVDRYYKKIEMYAKETGEWKSLKQGLSELANYSNDSAVRLNKKRIIESLGDFYQCTIIISEI